MKLPVRLFPIFVTFLLFSYSGDKLYATPPPTRAATSSLGTDASPSSVTADTVIIPGPLRSFMRMAGISQKVTPADVLPLLARNVYMQGYRTGQQTEFLILLDRYVHQARELQILAGTKGIIRVASCDDVGTLIQILGYRLRQGCGQKNFFLETANPERAFLTIDSGFPLTELEEALQNGTPFTYSFPSSRVPALFKESDWIALSAGEKKGFGSLVDVLINDQGIARLYWAFSKEDAETRLALLHAAGLKRLLPFSSVLAFYGSQLRIRSGHVILPGDASQGWKELVGASPESPGEFVPRLLAKDGGWLAAYFDVLSRVSKAQQEQLTQVPRLKHLYDAFRPSDQGLSATRGVFRKDPGLLLLFTRLEWEPTGEPHVPGNLEVWKDILHQQTDSKIVKDWAKRARSWDHPEQLLEAMTAFSRTETDSGPLQTYLLMCSLDAARRSTQRLSPATVRLLARRFSELDSWYLIFSEFPQLNGDSIARFVDVADAINGIKSQTLRGNTLGIFQSNIGLWQILARQRQIPDAQLNTSWQKALDPFVKISSSTQLFDAARTSLGELLLGATGKATATEDDIIDLLAGPHQESADGRRIHQEMAGRIRSVLEDQRLASLDTLFALSDGLSGTVRAGASTDRLLSLAEELREFELPRPIFTQSEKITWAPRVYSSHHAELQVRTDLTKVIKAPGSHLQLEAARGQLTPFLRDTLVGLNYAYYEPPGAQILHNHPLFVRSHDFSGVSVIGPERLWQAPVLLGAGTPAGGGAYLMGSLAELSYALAFTEQNFISPENVQALIWKELVPDLMVSATVPRWWDVTSNELHAVALYQRSGEELLTASAKDLDLRNKVIAILTDRLTSQRLEETEHALIRPEGAAAILPEMLPADTFYLAAEFHRRFPERLASLGPATEQLDNLRQKYPEEVSWDRLSRDFGVPHPTLTRSYGRELLNVKPFPFFGGYSSRLFSESWDSSNLYWARLADEMGYSPVMLNRLVPELTRMMTAKIFATDLEDWPAMSRAMRETGEEFRRGKVALSPAASATSPASVQTARDAKTQ